MKKKSIFHSSWLWKKTIVIPLAMKLLTLLMFAGSMAFSATTYSQKAKFDLKFENSSFTEILNAIEKNSEFIFVYNSNVLNADLKQSISVENQTIDEVLSLLLKDANVSYRIDDRQVFLYLKDEQKKSGDAREEVKSDQPQKKEISGSAKDSKGVPLPGVSVIVKGTTTGSITDTDGKFRLAVPADATTLVFSFIGMKKQEIAIGNNSSINVTLAEEVVGIDEIVAIGYGTARKKDITGSITSVNAVNLQSRSIVSVQQGLQGLVPGLNVVDRNASPGEMSAITIRGASSITAGTDPLWVVDGFPTDQRNAAAISPGDVESVEILKDASATAIFGSRGGNGVIIVTTKTGKSGASVIDVDVNSGISYIPQSGRLRLLNAKEYVEYYTEKNGGTRPAGLANWDGKTDTNWQDLIFKTGAFQNYSVSAHGGAEKVTYLLSSNFINQEGVVIGEGQKKYSSRLKLDYHPSDKIKVELNLAPNYTSIKKSGPYSDWSSLQAQASLLPPTLPVKRSNGTYAFGGDVSGMYPIGNPLETAKDYSNRTEFFRMLAGLDVSIQILDGLTVKSALSANIGSDKNKVLYNSPGPRFDMPSTSFLNVSQNQQFNWINENTINYKKSWGKHSFDALGGFSLQKNHYEGVGARVSELQIIGPEVVSIGNSKTLVGSNGIAENSIVSLLGRVNYAYKDRYLFTGTVRNDGSSRFGANNRYKTFASFALGWRLSEEDFIKKLGFVDNAKLRASYGSTGSNDITDYVSRASYFPINQSFGGTPVFGVQQGDPGNPGLTWELSKKLDIGLDLSLFGGRFNMVFDYYDNQTSGLILSRNLVPSSGYGGFLTNIGSLQNSGFEFSPTVRVIEKNDFTWSVGGNVTHNNQKILNLGGDKEVFNFFGALRRVVGGPLQQMKGPKPIGIARPGVTYPAQPTIKPGEVVYLDADKNGSIGNFLSDDGILFGDTNPDWVYGLNTSVKYKNFELSALLTGQAGAYVYDFIQIQVQAPIQPLVNLSKAFWYDGRYISESQPGNGRTPSAAAAGSDGVLPVSTFGVQKTDYLRIRNITLNYTLPESVLRRLGKIKGARVYTTIENLVTFTKFIGNNPEGRRTSVGGPSLIGSSQLSGVGDGMELGLTSPQSVPIPRIWTLGLNFTF